MTVYLAAVNESRGYAFQVSAAEEQVRTFIAFWVLKEGYAVRQIEAAHYEGIAGRADVMRRDGMLIFTKQQKRTGAT